MSHKLLSLKRSIASKAELWHNLAIAMELELSTIPAYLCGIYSIKPGTNQPAIDVMHSVVIEEMLHLTLAGNILTATGGPSKLNQPEFVPDYPTQLPQSDIYTPDGKHFTVPLQKFSRAAIRDTFMAIEAPEPKSDPQPGKTHGYNSIGEFYDGLATELQALCADLGTAAVFNGKIEDQVLPHEYYGAAGHFVVVADADPDRALENALRAIEEIVEQGEGAENRQGQDQVFDCDFIPGRGAERFPVPAHYYRFDEINQGQYYVADDDPGRPSGKVLPVDWDAVYNMNGTSKMRDYPPGSEIHRELVDFNRTYMDLLNLLNDAFSGKPENMMKAVGVMYDLKYKAVALMKIPSGKDDGTTVGPSFEYLAPDT